MSKEKETAPAKPSAVTSSVPPERKIAGMAEAVREIGKRVKLPSGLWIKTN